MTLSSPASPATSTQPPQTSQRAPLALFRRASTKKPLTPRAGWTATLLGLCLCVACSGEVTPHDGASTGGGASDGMGQTGGGTTDGSSNDGSSSDGDGVGGRAAGGGTPADGGSPSADGGNSSGQGGAAMGGGGSSTGATNGGAEPSGPCYDQRCPGVCRGDCEGGFVCDETPRACTDDLATYCGCDGAVFYDSGSCPSHAYQNRGSCKGEAPLTFNCDERDIICQPLVAPEPCPEGEAYSVENGCHGSCVPISQCGCESADECPDPENKDEFTCLLSEQHCSYWLR